MFSSFITDRDGNYRLRNEWETLCLNFKWYAIIAFTIGCLVIGCGKSTRTDPHAVDPEQSIIKHLPTGATNVKVLGNEWATFDLDVQGRVRHFMYRSHRPCSSNSTQLIVELRD